MNDNRLGDILHHLRQLVRPELNAGLSDGELLRRWVAQRDEAAFEVLVWRHGALVLGVCRRVLRDAHEAEDALQATFLALARKASSIGRREALAGWLYRVAFRAALEAKSRAAKRPALGGDNLASLAAGPSEDLIIWRDLRPVLDEEVNRLPAKYRVPFVLRHLEGRTNEEVARALHCPVGTVLSRLARAREQLRRRLTRRGLAFSAGALAAGLGSKAWSATVPPGIIGALVQAAGAVAAGRTPAVGLISANTAAVAEGVLRGMAITKLKLFVVLILAVSLLGTGGAVLAHRLNAGQAPAPGAQAAAPPDGKGTAEKPAHRPNPEEPRQVDKEQSAEKRAAEADAALKRKRDAEQKERALQQEVAKLRLLQAEDKYRAFEAKFGQALELWRQDQVREEEHLHSLEREQAAERDRERAAIKAAEAAILKAGRDDRAEHERLEGLDVAAKKRETERTERFIEARQKLVRAEERLRQLEREQGLQRELAQGRVRSAAERVLQLEEDRPPLDAQARALGEVERKMDSLLREIGELRRAVEKQSPSKSRLPER